MQDGVNTEIGCHTHVILSYTILHILVVTLNGVSPIQCWISLVFYQGVLPGKTDRLAPTDGVSLSYVF